ncbi:MAG: hypothetical protein GEU97_02005 [Actinophytocola sp.]|nr:hypothetical protein [Actinophytocola sp.]
MARLSLRPRVADRLARFVNVRVDRKLRPATREWQRRLDVQMRPLAQRLDRHRARLNQQRRSIARLATSVEELRRELRQTNSAVERIIPQVAAQEDRIETLRGRLAVAPSAEYGDVAEARGLIEEVQRQHAQIRVRLSGIAFYEERLRKLEDALTSPGSHVSASAAGE